MTSKAIFVVALTAFAATVGPAGTAQADPPTQVTYQVSGAAPVADYISYQVADGQTAAGAGAAAVEDAFRRRRQPGVGDQRPGRRLDHLHDPGRRQGGESGDRKRGAGPHCLLDLTGQAGRRGFGGG